MPITSDAVRADLAQGDLLRNVVLHHTGHDCRPQPLDVDFVLVVSRDCNAIRATKVAVVPVVKCPVDLIAPDFDKLVAKLSDVRDGPMAPDRLYIGTIGDARTRYNAHLDSPYTICIPTPGNARAAWIAGHRVARLTEPFRVSLPRRLFGAYGRVGFDDHDWFCTLDLEALVNKGRGTRHELKHKLAEIRTQISNAEANASAERALKQMKQNLKNAQTNLEAHEAKFAPYEVALDKRNRGLDAPQK